jgi:hypothetical protein
MGVNHLNSIGIGLSDAAQLGADSLADIASLVPAHRELLSCLVVVSRRGVDRVNQRVELVLSPCR